MCAATAAFSSGEILPSPFVSIDSKVGSSASAARGSETPHTPTTSASPANLLRLIDLIRAPPFLLQGRAPRRLRELDRGIRSGERPELALLRRDQTRLAVGGEAPGLGIERHRHRELEQPARGHVADAGAAQRPPPRTGVGRTPVRHPLDPVDDALAVDGRVDRAKTHVILLFILAAACARSAALSVARRHTCGGQPARRTFVACRPLGPSVMSNSTCWPSARDLKPSATIAV